mgnify:CR=1 FL=1
MTVQNGRIDVPRPADRPDEAHEPSLAGGSDAHAGAACGTRSASHPARVPRSTPEPVTFQLAPDLNGEYSLSSSDLRHRAVFSGIWEVHGGFQVSGTHYMGVGQRAQTISRRRPAQSGWERYVDSAVTAERHDRAAQRLHSARA